MISSRRAKTLIIVLTGILIIGLLLWAGVRESTLSARITVEVAPASDSKITLNGKGIRAGVSKVRPGKYDLVFSHAGFSTIHKSVSVDKDQNYYVGAALEPNSEESSDWYIDHPDDNKKAEGISSKNFDQVTFNQQKSMPIIRELPFVDLLFSVNYGRSLERPADPNAVALYIKHYNEEGKRQALDWLKFKGYDPSKIEIVYESGI